MDYLTVLEAPKGPIGFLGSGFITYAGDSPWYLGIRLNNALIGERAGYYTFGYEVGGHIPLTPSVRFSPNAQFTAGGGAESNDGSGGFWTGAASLDYKLGRWNLGLGGQYSYVSTGVIQGASPYLSLTYDQDFSKTLNQPLNMDFFVNTMYSAVNEHGRGTGFIGIGGRSYADKIYASAYLTAAVTDLGGYMDVYVGTGTYHDLGPVRLLAEVNYGTGGGGRAPAGGGALWGGQFELQYRHRNHIIGLSNGVISSVGEPFYAQFTSLRIGTNIGVDSQHSTRSEFHPGAMQAEASVRYYLGDAGFGNIGAAFHLYGYHWLSLRGETYWAMTDGRGAYAEGLFGLRLQPGWAYAEVQIGAGAGGGINLWNGAGLAFANAGIDIPVNPRYSVNLKGIYNLYSTTPFPTWGVQAGLGYKFPFKFK